MDLHPPTDRPPGLATIRVPYLSFTASYASLDNHRAGPDPPHRPRDRAKRSLSISCSPRAPLRFHRSRGKRENPDTFVIENAYIRRRRRKKYIFPSAWEGLISILSGQFGKEPRIIGPENVDRLSRRRVCGRCIRTCRNNRDSFIRSSNKYRCVLFVRWPDNRVAQFG